MNTIIDYTASMPHMHTRTQTYGEYCTQTSPSTHNMANSSDLHNSPNNLILPGIKIKDTALVQITHQIHLAQYHYTMDNGNDKTQRQ